MNYIDLILIGLVLVSVLSGIARGLAASLIDLLGWVGGLALALYFAGPLGTWLAPFTPWSAAWEAPAAFLLIIALSSILAALAGTALRRRKPPRKSVNSADHILGALPGLIGGMITAALVAMILLLLPLPTRLQEDVNQSSLAGRLAEPASQALEPLVPIFSGVAADIMPLRIIPPESDERIELPFTVGDFETRPDLEAQLLERLNQERATAGLPPLAPDPALTTVAREHAIDMFTRGYFAHVTPEGRGPFDRINAAAISYQAAGENLALAPTLERAHSGLMQSPGHRANILRPLFGRAGIGIIDGGIRGLMVVQLFRD